MRQRRSRTVLVWGDGSVGTGLAAALSAVAEVTLVGLPGSGRGPVEIESKGAYPAKAAVTRAESEDPVRADCCVVAVKAYDLRAAAGPAASSVPGRCVCVCNGMGLEDEWGPSWGDRVEPAVLTAGFRLVGRGLVETSSGTVVAAAGGCAESLFAGIAIPVELTDDIEALRWAKWLVNSVVNPLGALTGLPNNLLLDAGLRPTAEAVFSELLEGVPEAFRERAGREGERMLESVMASSTNLSSMLQDVESGRPTEIDHLTGLHEKLLRNRPSAAGCVTDLVRARTAFG